MRNEDPWVAVIHLFHFALSLPFARVALSLNLRPIRVPVNCKATSFCVRLAKGEWESVKEGSWAATSLILATNDEIG
jgi:hypothetical protein